MHALNQFSTVEVPFISLLFLRALLETFLAEKCWGIQTIKHLFFAASIGLHKLGDRFYTQRLFSFYFLFLFNRILLENALLELNH